MSINGNILTMTSASRTNKGKKKEAAFSLFARNYTLAEIASELKVSIRTLSRWKIDYQKISSQPKTDNTIVLEAQNDLSERLNDLLELAFNTVEEVLSDINARKSDKLKAASMVADWARLGRTSKEELESEKNKFPLEVAQAQENLTNLSDDELKKLYFQNLQESSQ